VGIRWIRNLNDPEPGEVALCHVLPVSQHKQGEVRISLAAPYTGYESELYCALGRQFEGRRQGARGGWLFGLDQI
jgi:hypothetical protein